jgi:hypothetical protein
MIARSAEGTGGQATPHPASYRDPAGTVFVVGGRIVRGLTAEGAAQYAAVERTGLLDTLAAAGKIVGTRDVTAERLLQDQPRFVRVLEHDRIPFVSYPYEWSFPLLQSAALLHLDIQLEALAKGVTLSDATAYNIQFRGPNPVFIDILSFRPYRPG